MAPTKGRYQGGYMPWCHPTLRHAERCATGSSQCGESSPFPPNNIQYSYTSRLTSESCLRATLLRGQ
eukprot:scaffold101256_cov72-Phaeocystis_antarctica.AAC.9